MYRPTKCYSIRLFAIASVLLPASCATRPNAVDACTQEIHPAKTWLAYATPEEAGFSSEKLAQAQQYSDEIGSAAVMVIHNGAVVAHWGDIEKRYMCHSIRKSFLSALYGIHVADGNIDLDMTMADLGIDDKPPLTTLEKQASIRDLLKARSGVYHSAAYETEAMKKRRPKRGSHAPGTFYYYNNWDFNVLGAIFEQQTHSTIFSEFQTRIAEPLQMQDFRVQDCYYHLEKQHSMYPAYPFRMSARDMARFGLLFLREGRWKDRQIITKGWIRESTTQYSTKDSTYGYAYLWWNITASPFRELGAYTASGYGGHLITVVPEADLVFVHRVDTWWDLGFSNCPKGTRKSVGSKERLKLLGMVLDAKVSEPEVAPELAPLAEVPGSADIVRLDSSTLDRYSGEYIFPDDYIAQIKKDDGNLLISSPGAGTFTLLPLSPTRFIMEDTDAPVSFEIDDDGKPLYMAVEFAPGEKCCGVLVPAEETDRKDLASVTRKLDALTPKLMTDMRVPGVSISVISDGQIAWHKGYGAVRAVEPGKVTPETVFEACSMSKVVFTYAVLKLVEQGKLDLDRPLVDYLDEPYLEDEPLHRLITARMVMTHTTGFPNWREGGWRKDGPLPVKFKPGTEYGYSGEGYLYLQRVVEHITGKPLSSFMKETLLEPIGMASSSYVWEQRYDRSASAGHDRAGEVKPNRRLYNQANAAYSLYCTADDYARFIIEVMSEDRSAEHSLSRESIAEMLTPTTEVKGSHGRQVPRAGRSSCVSVHRGLGWVVGETDDGGIRAWHSGSNGTGFRCYSEFDPANRTGIVIMTGSVNGKSLYQQLVSAIAFP
ncbi:MAG: serine hydrolase [Phycisphaerales bacterium]|nr:MAG: serine hydrolase [Phycisphaerales bacterium]